MSNTLEFREVTVVNKSAYHIYSMTNQICLTHDSYLISRTSRV